MVCQNKFVKIGVADDPEYRLNTFQTGNPHKLKLKGLVLCKSKKSAYGVEEECHRKCFSFRQRGEWFRYTESEKKINNNTPSKHYLFSLLLKIITIRGEQSQRLVIVKWPDHALVETTKIRDKETNLITGQHQDLLLGQ